MQTYQAIVTPDESGAGFNAEIPALKGCMAHGETKEEALDVLCEMKQIWLGLARERGWPIPEPDGIELAE